MAVADGGGALIGRWGHVDWAVGWGSPEKKLGTGGGGLEGWPGRRRTGGCECFWGGQGGCLAGGGWRLEGVEVEDELQALDFVSNGSKID